VTPLEDLLEELVSMAPEELTETVANELGRSGTPRSELWALCAVSVVAVALGATGWLLVQALWERVAG